MATLSIENMDEPVFSRSADRSTPARDVEHSPPEIVIRPNDRLWRSSFHVFFAVCVVLFESWPSDHPITALFLFACGVGNVAYGV